MAGSGTLGIGTSALLTYQRALQTTSHNISNANTPGYSRQVVEQSTQFPDNVGGYYVGRGVKVDGVKREVDTFVNGQVTDAQASNSRYQTYSQYADQVDKLLADQSAGLQPALQDFFNAVQGVANAPASIPARQELISQGKALTGRFNTLYAQIHDISRRLNGEIGHEVSQINDLAHQIAQLNTEIVSRQNGNVVGQPNDLLDKRDALIKQLAKHINIKTVEQKNGSVNVVIGTGQALVVGSNVTELGTRPLDGNPDQIGLVFKTSSADVPISNIVAGGTLGGLLSVRNQVLVPTINSLGRLAIGISHQFNQQQAAGVDLQGKQGSPFFKVPTAAVYSGPDNAASSGVPTVTISDIGKLTTEDYQLGYDQGKWTLRIAGSGQPVAMTGAGTASNPFKAGGLSIVVPSSVSAGDRFAIEPTRHAARDIYMQATDPRQIAASAPVAAAATKTNTGTAKISGMQVSDATQASLHDKVTVTMLSPTAYKVVDDATGKTLASGLTYTPSGTPISFNGWKLELSGAAAAGDTFVIEPTGPGDNHNALALAALQDGRFLQGGTASLGETYNQLVTDVGTRTQTAQNDAKTQQSLLNQAVALQQSISGVNLDQEAANLIKYQQAYQASAKVITTANTMFDSLLQAVR